jgi:hypothetical protein
MADPKRKAARCEPRDDARIRSNVLFRKVNRLARGQMPQVRDALRDRGCARLRTRGAPREAA